MKNSTSRRDFLRSSAVSVSALALSRTLPAESQQVDAHVEIMPEESIGMISPEIYSHFIEQLGGVVYDGVWVGRNSRISNKEGVRTAFVDAMRAVKAPVLRWPGGCFADSYSWRDGIGPKAKRPSRAAFWDQQDSNEYGLHEFMHTCRSIGCKPYLAANLRSQPASEFAAEIEYCNAPAGDLPSHSAATPRPDTLALERAANGDKEPFNVDLWGVGNESWGCGGNLLPEEYAEEFRRFTAFTPSYSATPLRFVAVAQMETTWTGRGVSSIRSTPIPNGASCGASRSTTTPQAARPSLPAEMLCASTTMSTTICWRAAP